MPKITTIAIILLCSICQMGCQEKSRTAPAPKQGESPTVLAVKFQNDSSIKYRMISERNVTVDLDSSAGKAEPKTMFEKLELVMSYSPVGQVNPYGITKMKAVCEFAKVTRRDLRGRSSSDVADLLAGRNFTFTISPVGNILDYSEMDKLVLELGNKSIKESGKRGRIKSPDMIADFVSLQKHLWDPVASALQGTVGVDKGLTWKSLEYIPLPVPVRAANEITYTLVDGAGDQAETEGAEKIVEIQSTFALSDKKISDWPRLYEGSFSMQGMFGFLRNYKFKSLEGSGVQIFNVDSGVVENDKQKYIFTMEASFPMPLGDPPVLTVDQTITIELMKD